MRKHKWLKWFVLLGGVLFFLVYAFLPGANGVSNWTLWTRTNKVPKGGNTGPQPPIVLM